MSVKSVVALLLLAFILAFGPAIAQQEPSEEDPTFKLLRDSGTADSALEIGEEEEEIWIPGLRKGTVEVSFALGVLNMKSTLLEHEQIIYDYTEQATYWGDTKLEGNNAFSPMLRIGYNLSPWLCLEGVTSLSFSEYSSSIVNRHRRSNEPGSGVDFEEPALGEFTAEKRSLLTINAGLNASVYFLNLDGDGGGRWHPYATAGVGNIWYSVNSNYVDDAASALDYNFGGGVRLLADQNISIRFEVVYHINTFAFTPSDRFTELNEGTVVVPIDEFPIIDEIQQQIRVTEYSENSIGALGISIGIQGSF
jgi:hypothetical protein